MIAAQPARRHTTGEISWQQALAEAYTDPVGLLAALGLGPGDLHPPQTAATLQAAANLFPLRVPGAYVDRMKQADPRDPLLLQVLAHGAETLVATGFDADPLHEQAARRVPGLLHKYAGRALLVTTGACAVHCRYCFRRHYDYTGDQAEGQPRWAAALAAIAADPGIEEVILSGGDPLSLSNARLASLVKSLEALPQVRRIRLHTRTPIVLPARVDAGLLETLQSVRGKLVIVVHANHANELDQPTAAALLALRGACDALLNQSVLLAGVNDDVDALAALSRRLFECGVLPYYLHQLDRVAGAAHFEVDDLRARELAAALNARLPGYLVPRLVREVAGAPGKLPLDPAPGASGSLPA